MGCPSLFVHPPASLRFGATYSPLPLSPCPTVPISAARIVVCDPRRSIWSAASRCTDPQRRMLKAGLDLCYRRLISLPPPAIAGHQRGKAGGCRGHGWRWEQMAGRVTSVVRLSGSIIPLDGPPALLPFPAPGRPGLPRQRRPAATRGCPGRERAALSPHLVPLLLTCPVQRELDLRIPAR